MPQYGTFDLGSVLRDAEAIKSYQRGSRLDDLREIALREGIDTQRQTRDLEQKQFDADQQRANTTKLLSGIRIAQQDPSLLPTLANGLAAEGILDQEALPQLLERAQTDPDGFNAGLKQLESQLMYALGQEPEKPSGEGFTLSPGQTRFDAEGKPVASVNDPAESLKTQERLNDERLKNLQTEEGLRKEFNDLTKDFRKVSDAYARVEASAKEPSAAGDLALIFNYMKMLDPGSTVREGEFANAEQSGSVPATIVARYNKLIAGERLSEEMRGDFLERSASLFNAQFDEARKTADQYKTLATKAGVDADSVIATIQGRDHVSAPQESTPDGTVIENDQGQRLVKRNGEWVPQ